MFNKRFGERVPLFVVASAFKGDVEAGGWIVAGVLFFWEVLFLLKKNKQTKLLFVFLTEAFRMGLQCWKPTPACWERGIAQPTEDLTPLYSAFRAAVEPERHRGMKNKIKRHFFGFAPASQSCAACVRPCVVREDQLLRVEGAWAFEHPCRTQPPRSPSQRPPRRVGVFLLHTTRGWAALSRQENPQQRITVVQKLLWDALWDVQVGLCISYNLPAAISKSYTSTSFGAGFSSATFCAAAANSVLGVNIIFFFPPFFFCEMGSVQAEHMLPNSVQ